jgi:hypothetical protein
LRWEKVGQSISPLSARIAFSANFGGVTHHAEELVSAGSAGSALLTDCLLSLVALPVPLIMYSVHSAILDKVKIFWREKDQRRSKTIAIHIIRIYVGASTDLIT